MSQQNKGQDDKGKDKAKDFKIEELDSAVENVSGGTCGGCDTCQGCTMTGCVTCGGN